jgi:hypothetical protein
MKVIALTKLGIGSLDPFRGVFAPFAGLGTLDLSGNKVSLSGVVDVLQSGELPPSLATIVLANNKISNLSGLGRLLERPVPKPLKIVILDDFAVSVHSATSLPCLTLDLRGNNSDPSTLPSRLYDLNFKFLADRGELTCSHLDKASSHRFGLAYLMDEYQLDLLEQQLGQFPDFDADHLLFRVPLSLIGRLAKLVRSGRPFSAEVFVEGGVAGLPVPGLGDLGPALAQAASVRIKFISSLSNIWNGRHQIPRPFPSDGTMLSTLLAPLLQGLQPVPSLSIAISPAAFFTWEPADRSLSMASVSAAVMGAVANAILITAGPSLSSVDIGLSSPSDLDLTGEAGSLLRALLVAPEALTITCRDLDVAAVLAVLSGWARMIKDGAPRGLNRLVMDGRMALRIQGGGSAYLRLNRANGFAQVGLLISELSSCFGITSVVVESSVSEAVSLEDLDTRGWGNALSHLESCEFSITQAVKGIPSSPHRLLAHLAKQLMDESRCSPARLKVIVGDGGEWLEWAHTGGGGTLSMISLAASFNGTDELSFLGDLLSTHRPAVFEVNIAFSSCPCVRWASGSHRSLLVIAGLPASELSKVASVVSRSSIIPDSVRVTLNAPSDLEGSGDLLRMMLHAKEVNIWNCTVLPVLAVWDEMVRSETVKSGAGWVVVQPLWEQIELAGRDGTHVWQKGASATVSASKETLPQLCVILCHTFGVRGLSVDLRQVEVPVLTDLDLSPVVDTLSSLPVTSLAVIGYEPGWAVGVIRSGPGPLRSLIFSKCPSPGDIVRISELLRTNESLVSVGVHTGRLDLPNPPQVNFRLLSGSSSLSARNRRLRSSLASALSPFSNSSEIVPPELGFAIRRAQARTTPL